MNAAYLRDEPGGVRLALKVHPRSSKVGPRGVLAEQLKWGVRAAPSDGEANEELIESLSNALKLPKSKIKLLSGATGRSKVLMLEGITSKEVIECFNNLL